VLVWLPSFILNFSDFSISHSGNLVVVCLCRLGSAAAAVPTLIGSVFLDYSSGIDPFSLSLKTCSSGAFADLTTDCNDPSFSLSLRAFSIRSTTGFSLYVCTWPEASTLPAALSTFSFAFSENSGISP